MKETYDVILEDTDTRILPCFGDDEPGEFQTFAAAKAAVVDYCVKMIDGLRRVLHEMRHAENMPSYCNMTETQYRRWQEELELERAARGQEPEGQHVAEN